MSLYRVTITRDITESATVEVEADSLEEAAEKALKPQDDDLTWELDDCQAGDAYLAGGMESIELADEEEEEASGDDADATLYILDGTLGFNHGCTDYAVFRDCGDGTAVCIEVQNCHSCHQVGHDQQHEFARIGEVESIERLLDQGAVKQKPQA